MSEHLLRRRRRSRVGPSTRGWWPRHRTRSSRRRLGGDGGSATAETAVVLPSLVLVLLLAVWGVMVAVAQLRCVDAASTSARALARNEPAALVVAAAQTAGPRGARVGLARGSDTVTVTVAAEVGWPGSTLSRLPALAVTGRATAAREDVSPAVVEIPR